MPVASAAAVTQESDWQFRRRKPNVVCGRQKRNWLVLLQMWLFIYQVRVSMQ